MKSPTKTNYKHIWNVCLARIINYTDTTAQYFNPAILRGL